MKYPPIFYWKYTFNYNGFIIPRVGIVINEKLRHHPRLEYLLRHERVHWNQSKRCGLVTIFVILYVLDVLYHGYDLSLFEIEARYEENKLAKYHYTWAVRHGLAKTPENPEFRKGKKFNNPI